MRAEAVGGVIGFPHGHKRGRTEDERARLFNLFKVLDNRRTDVTFAEPDDIGDEDTAVCVNNPNGLGNRYLLKIRQLRCQLVCRCDAALIRLYPIFYQFVERLHIDVVRTNRGEGPRGLHLLHQRLVKILCFVPQRVKPVAKLHLIGVARHDDVQFGVAG